VYQNVSSSSAQAFFKGFQAIASSSTESNAVALFDQGFGNGLSNAARGSRD
jgi:hypothetical protein